MLYTYVCLSEACPINQVAHNIFIDGCGGRPIAIYTAWQVVIAFGRERSFSLRFQKDVVICAKMTKQVINDFWV